MTDEEKMKIASLLATASPEGARAIANLYGIEISTPTTAKEPEATVLKFLNTGVILNGIEVVEGYKQYIQFCQENNLHPVTQRSFSHQVNKALNYVTQGKGYNGGLNHRFFIDPKDPPEFQLHDETTEAIQNFIDSGYFLEYAKVKDYSNQVTSFVYDIFSDFCVEKDLYCTNNIVFSRKFCELTGYAIKNKKINGVIRRVFYLPN